MSLKITKDENGELSATKDEKEENKTEVLTYNY